MIREVKFESQDRRIKQILAALNENGIKDIEEANAICEAAGLDPYKTCEETQPICFENAKWAYVVGSAIALKKGCKNAAEAAEAIGIGLQAFCIPGSVADDRKVGIGHGNLAAMLLREETKCFAFLAGHVAYSAAFLTRPLDPLGLVLKAGEWYLVGRGKGRIGTYRAAMIGQLTVLDEGFDSPPGFDLARWQAHPHTTPAAVSR